MNEVRIVFEDLVLCCPCGEPTEDIPDRDARSPYDWLPRANTGLDHHA